MNTVLTETRTHKGRSKSERAHHRMKGVVSPRLAKKRRMHAGFVAGGAFSDFTYNGGPVIETPQVFALFVGDWGSSANQTRATRLQQFVDDMLNSEYMNVLSQYGCGTSGSLVNSVFIPSTDHELSDHDIHEILQRAIDNNTIPDASPSNAYVLFLDDATAVNDPGTGTVMCEATSDTAFGYHFFFRTTGGANCYYAVVPGLTDACLQNSCPSSDSTCSLHLSQTREERQTQVASHELAEMFSDPEVDFNEAWTSASGPHENGDICNGESGTITVGSRTWTIQLMYSKSDDMSSGGATTCIASLSNPLPAFVPWRHLTELPGHPLGADVDCSGLQQGAKSVTLADVDGDKQAEMIVAASPIFQSISFRQGQELILLF